MSYQTVGATGVTSFNKIPEYAREYKKEYLFIRGINKELKYLVDNIHKVTKGLFMGHKADRLKYFIKRFLRGQERGKLKDISNFEIEEDDVKNIIEIKEEFCNLNKYYDFFEDDGNVYYDDDDDDKPFVDPYPGYKNIKDDFEIFYNKIKIEYYDSDSDSEIEIILPSSDSEIDSYSDSDIF